MERQRRETLNGRFLDLAGLLPNLSQIRRPSKSSIVNSSIAHINASRRHRALASRELRALKIEADALRRELNEWRDRSNLPRVEEPVRGDGFNMVLSGELEVLAAVVEDEEDAAQGQQGYDGFDDADDDYPVMSDADDAARLATVAMLKSSAPTAAFIPQLLARPAHGPMIATTPPNVSFENPAMASLYEAAPFEYLQSQSQAPAQPDVEKWSAQLYQQQQQPRAFLNPPSSAHPLSAPSSASGTPPQNLFMDPSNQAFFNSFQRQQQHLSVLQQQQQQMERIFGSPERDDASSISSSGRTHERSGSVGSGGYGTPPLTSPTDYDFGAAGITDFGAPSRRISTGGLHVSVPGARSSWCHPGDASTADNTMGMMAQNIGLPISVGGGGNSNGFLMRMV